MCDSDDDYFTDDWVLDDKTLAVLDEEESKFKRATNSQARQSTRQTAGPPPKRQKTSELWQPPLVRNAKPLRRAETLEDMDDLPDVSVRHDGTYGLQDKQRRTLGPPSRSGIVPGPSLNVAVQAAPGTRPPTAAPVSASRGPVPAVRSTSGTGSARVAQAPSHPPSSARGPRSTQSPVSSQEIPRTQSGLPQRLNRVSSTGAPGPNGYIDQLLREMDELRKRNEAMQAEMQSALNAKFVKDGEVTILRKRIEKTAQDHLTQIVKLKSAKEEADAKNVLLQKQFEAEKERLKTELTFRRHELETSSRMHPPGGLHRNGVTQTLEPLLTQRQKSSQWGSAGPSRLAPETPRRPRFGVNSDFDKSKKITVPEARALPSGFQTSPLRSQSTGGLKGKEHASFNAPKAAPVTLNASPICQEPNTQLSQPEGFDAPLDDGGLVPDFDLSHVDSGVNDIHMVDEGTPVMTLSSQDNTSVLALPSQNLVLHDIMVTHTLQGLELPTLQLLICASPKDVGQVQSYGAVLMRIFNTLGGITAQSDRDFNNLARVICCALCEITEFLAKNNLIVPLTAVLNLLAKITYILPSIHVLLLHAPGHDETPRLLRVLHNIIEDQLSKLDVTTGCEPPELCSLGKETLYLYQALVLRIPEDLEDSVCLTEPTLLPMLLHPNRPLWFHIESAWLLVWLATRWRLFRSLLSRPTIDLTVPNDGDSPADAVHSFHLGLACCLLTDTDRRGPEADELKRRIIMFFSLLSNAHPDAYTLLVESQELIPSIVSYLYYLAEPIWRESETLFDDPPAAARTIDMISHAMLLLHHLVTGEDATLDLREHLLGARAKMQEAPIHLFILTFGRLSYASPPHWLGAKDTQRLMAVGALARPLLERVIQGPELDLIWETYQDESDETNETRMDVDEEEVQEFAHS